MRKILYIVIAVIVLTFASCLSTRTTIGDGPVETDTNIKVYSSAKQSYFFWGIFALPSDQPPVPEHGNVQIKTSFDATDILISVVTAGIFSMQSIKVIVKKDDFDEIGDINNVKTNFAIGDKVSWGNKSMPKEGTIFDLKKEKAAISTLNSIGDEKLVEIHYERLTLISKKVIEVDSISVATDSLTNEDIYYKTSAGVNMRKGAGTNFDKVTSIAKGSRVKLIAKTNDEWYEIEFNEITGFVSSKYLIED